MRLIKFIAILIVALPANADVFPWPVTPASESEMTLIAEATGFDSADESTKSRILRIEGLRRYVNADSYILAGVVWWNPVLVRGHLCIMERDEVLGEPVESGYEWGRHEPLSSYRNWLPHGESACEIDEPSEVDAALVIYEPIPSESLIRILEGADRLIEAVLSHPDAETFRGDEYEWVLSEVRLSSLLDPVLGFAYEAMLDSDAGFGPLVTFTIQNGELIIQSVGMWQV